MVKILCHGGVMHGRRDAMSYLIVLIIVVVAADIVLGVSVLRRIPPSALIHQLLPFQSLKVRTRRLVARLTARLETARKGSPRWSRPKKAVGVDKPGGGAAPQSDGTVPEFSDLAEAVRDVDEFRRSLLAKRHGQVGSPSSVEETTDVETTEEKRASSPER